MIRRKQHGEQHSVAAAPPPCCSTAAVLLAAMRGKWDRNLKLKLAIMHQCTSVTDRQTDGLTSWHKREMYILHLALKSRRPTDMCPKLCMYVIVYTWQTSF